MYLVWMTLGKLRCGGPEVLVHPLVDHMPDVAASFWAWIAAAQLFGRSTQL